MGLPTRSSRWGRTGDHFNKAKEPELSLMSRQRISLPPAKFVGGEIQVCRRGEINPTSVEISAYASRHDWLRF